MIRAAGKLSQAAATRRNGRFTDMLLFNSGKGTLSRDASNATISKERNRKSRFHWEAEAP